MKMYSVIFSALLLLSACKSSTRDNYVSKDSAKESLKSAIGLEVVAENLFVPWSIVFTSKDRMLFTERDGKLRVIEKGELLIDPLHVFKEVSIGGEEGLMGLVLDPSYAENKFIYLSCAYPVGKKLEVKVVRFRDEGKTLSGEKIIIDHLPGAHLHCGCRLRFGPDGKLYITTGDAGERQFVQDKNNLYGKILRLNPDGSIPSDNPYPNNPLWSWGNRNPQGIDWYPGTNILFETEHGPSGFDGGTGGDEVNIIEKGKNYGWPVIMHYERKEGMETPPLEFTPAVAPASGMFYRSGIIPEFKNNFFFGCLRGSGIMRVVVDEKDPTKILSHQMLPEVNVGRIREVTEGPDGAIYFSTSNMDGRGAMRDGDDKIYRIVRK
jgi:glucose/arabinose dehydrogenase